MTKPPKKYTEKVALVKEKEYSLDEAVKVLTQVSTTKFDGTAEVHVRLFTDPAQGDQQVRSTISLPHGTGKDVRVAAIVPEDRVKEMLAAGASKAGEASLISEIEKGTIDFDVVVAVPSVMKGLGKIAKTLGQKGLMPSPKAGTVTDDPVHSIFGKISFGNEKLTENLRTLLQAIIDAKPASIKGEFLKSITITPTMGPGVRVALKSI